MADDRQIEDVKPTPEREARAAEAGANIRRVVVGQHLVRLIDDISALGILRRRDVIDDAQYLAGRWIQGKHRQSLESIGSCELRERVQGGGVITPEMILAARQVIEQAFAAVRQAAGADAALAVEQAALLDFGLEKIKSLQRCNREKARARLCDGLSALADWRAAERQTALDSDVRED